MHKQRAILDEELACTTRFSIVEKPSQLGYEATR